MWGKIEFLINKKGININQFSMDTKISSQLVYGWKKGKSIPSLAMLDKVSKYFDVPITYFLDGRLTEENENFTDDDLLLARELNKSDKVDLIKDIMKIQKEKDIEIIELITKKILEGQK